jgi:hypothetical protein
MLPKATKDGETANAIANSWAIAITDSTGWIPDMGSPTETDVVRETQCVTGQDRRCGPVRASRRIDEKATAGMGAWAFEE